MNDKGNHSPKQQPDWDQAWSYSPKWCLASDSSGDQVSLCHLDTVFKLYPGYQLGQVVEAA